MDTKKLEEAGDAIEMVLSVNGNPGRVTGGVVKTTEISFTVQMDENGSVGPVLDLATAIAEALGVLDVTVSRDAHDVARIDIPHSDDSSRLSLTKMLSRIRPASVPAITALLGLAEDGAPLMARLPSPDVGHISISGPAGCGKTSLIITMLLSMAHYNKPRHLQIAAFGSGLDCLRDLPHMLEVTNLERFIKRPSSEPKIVVAIDDPGFEHHNLVRAIAARSLTAGVYFIVSAPEPLGEPLGEPFKVFVTADHKLQQDQVKPGDFWADYNGQVIKFIAAHSTDDDRENLIQEITNNDKVRFIRNPHRTYPV